MPDKTKQIQKVIAEYCHTDVEEVKLNTRMQDLGLDSLDMVEIVMSVEDELDIEIVDFFQDPSITVEEYIALIEKHSGTPA